MYLVSKKFCQRWQSIVGAQTKSLNTATGPKSRFVFCFQLCGYTSGAVTPPNSFQRMFGKCYFKGACITSTFVVSSKILKCFSEVSYSCHVKCYLKRVKTKIRFYMTSKKCGWSMLFVYVLCSSSFYYGSSSPVFEDIELRPEGFY